MVLVASAGPLDGPRIASAIADRGGEEVVVSGAGVGDFAKGASPLVDDWAPVDQWLSRARGR